MSNSRNRKSLAGRILLCASCQKAIRSIVSSDNFRGCNSAAGRSEFGHRHIRPKQLTASCSHHVIQLWSKDVAWINSKFRNYVLD